MRIAIVTQAGECDGGVGTVVRMLRGGLRSRGHVVHTHRLASSITDPLSRRIAKPSTWRTAGRRAQSAEDSIAWGANWVEVERQRYLPRSKLTRELNLYDVVQVVSGTPATAFAVKDVQCLKALQVATILSQERPTQLRSAPFVRRSLGAFQLASLRGLEGRAVRSMDVVLVENGFMLSWVRAQGKENVKLIYPGVDTNRFTRQTQWDSQGPILCFGRLFDSRKDWVTAVTAYEDFISATGAPNRLLVAGAGPTLPEVMSKIRSSVYASRITVRENIPQDQLVPILSECSVMLQSSLEEGLGLAGLEAMSCGIPVVATATVGAREYVASGENGYVVPIDKNSAASLAEGLHGVLCSGEGTRLSANASETCRARFSSRSAIEQFERAYSGMS